MQKQEIVISPDVFRTVTDCILSGVNNFDIATYKANLKDKKFVFDIGAEDKSLLYDQIVEHVKSVPDFARKLCLSMFNVWKSDSIEFKNLSKSKKYFTDDFLNILVNIALQTNSKIINSENADLNSKISLKKMSERADFNEIEVLKINDIAKPPNQSKLKCSRKITLQKNDDFSFDKQIFPFISDTENIILKDRYIRKRSVFYSILKPMLERTKKLKVIEFVTILVDNPNDTKTKNFTCEELEKEILKITKTKIIFTESSREMHDRHLITDEYDLHFSSGFDFVDYKTWKVTREDVLIEIAKL